MTPVILSEKECVRSDRQGTMAVHAAPGQGTEVAIVLPLDLSSAVS
jgi:hypothetical protein